MRASSITGAGPPARSADPVGRDPARCPARARNTRRSSVGSRRPPAWVQHVVHDDPVEPGSEAAATLERREAGERLDEDFLGRVLGVLGVTEHANRDVVDPGLMVPRSVSSAARSPLWMRRTSARSSASPSAASRSGLNGVMDVARFGVSSGPYLVGHLCRESVTAPLTLRYRLNE